MVGLEILFYLFLSANIVLEEILSFFLKMIEFLLLSFSFGFFLLSFRVFDIRSGLDVFIAAP